MPISGLAVFCILLLYNCRCKTANTACAGAHLPVELIRRRIPVITSGKPALRARTNPSSGPGGATWPDPPIRLAPAKRRGGETVQEFVFRRLRHAIMTGRFPPGLAVTIRGLASLLGVSAMPVREAMRRLVAERALDLLDNRRVRVPDMDPARFDTLIAARILLEQEAARRALPHVTPATLAELHRLDEAADEVFARGDVERTIEANFAFHRRLYSLAPSDALMPLIESIWLQIGPFMRAALQGASIDSRPDRHADALAALAARDAAALTRAIEADVREGIQRLPPVTLRVAA
jgi:DNA-binding GntR family transcriptional regulator